MRVAELFEQKIKPSEVGAVALDELEADETGRENQANIFRSLKEILRYAHDKRATADDPVNGVQEPDPTRTGRLEAPRGGCLSRGSAAPLVAGSDRAVRRETRTTNEGYLLCGPREPSLVHRARSRVANTVSMGNLPSSWSRPTPSHESSPSLRTSRDDHPEPLVVVEEVRWVAPSVGAAPVELRVDPRAAPDDAIAVVVLVLSPVSRIIRVGAV